MAMGVFAREGPPPPPAPPAAPVAGGLAEGAATTRWVMDSPSAVLMFLVMATAVPTLLASAARPMCGSVESGMLRSRKFKGI